MLLRNHELFSRAIIPRIKEYDVIIKLSQVLARQLHLLNGWRLSSRRPKHNIGPCQRTGLTDTKVILALRDYVGATCHVCIGVANVLNKMQNCRQKHQCCFWHTWESF